MARATAGPVKALAVGGAMVDTIAIIDSAGIERMSLLNADTSYLLLEEGRKTEALEVSTHCGGGGANAAVALSRLGAETAALLKLGTDARAALIRDRLAAEGVDTRWIVQDGRAPTGASVHISSHDRNAAVFTFRGANTLLEERDLCDTAFKVDIVYVANLSSGSAARYPAIVDKAKRNGALLATNPGARQLSSQTEAFVAALPEIDILTLNRPEADILVASEPGLFVSQAVDLEADPTARRPRLASRGLFDGRRSVNLRAFFTALRRLGTGTVLLTDGADGAFATSGDEICYCPALKVEVAGTAGAGDAFATTFSAFSATGAHHHRALRAAAVNAASVLTHVDTQTGLLSRAALDDALLRSENRLPVTTWRL